MSIAFKIIETMLSVRAIHSNIFLLVLSSLLMRFTISSPIVNVLIYLLLI